MSSSFIGVPPKTPPSSLNVGLCRQEDFSAPQSFASSPFLQPFGSLPSLKFIVAETSGDPKTKSRKRIVNFMMNPKPMIARSSSSPTSFIFEIQLGRENGRGGRAAEEQHIVHRLRVNRTSARRSCAWQGGSEARGVYNGRSVQTLVSMRTSNAGVIVVVIRVFWEFNVRVWGCSMGDEGGYLRKSLGVCVAKKYEGGRVKLIQTEVDFEFQDEEILAGGVFRPSPSFNLTTPS